MVWAIILFSLYLIIFWLLVLARENVAEEGNNLQDEGTLPEYPMVTIAIPAWNEAENIQETIESVLALDYPPDNLEIIVVNDGSTDPTEAVVTQVMEEHEERNIRLVTQLNRGKGAALNTALRHATGEYFTPMDADSLIRQDALRHMIPRFSDPTVAAVLPVMKVREPSNLLQKIQWCEYLVSVFYKRLMAALDCVSVIPGPFSAYRTNVLRDMGGFHENNIAEDSEITLRLQNNHHKIVQTFSTEVYTKAPRTWRQFYRQRNRWYKGTFLNAWHYRKMALNSKYGDFGFIQMPRIMIESALLLFVSCTLIYSYALRPLIVQVKIYSLTGFNFSSPVFRHLVNLDVPDLAWVTLFLFASTGMLGLILIKYAHKHAGEPMRKHGYFVIPVYLFLFSVLVTIVHYGVFLDLIRGKVHKW